MRNTLTVLTVAAGLICALPGVASAQDPSRLLNGLLSGGQNPNQDQAVREAYERGYRAGHADAMRDERGQNDRNRSPRGGYADPDGRGGYSR